MARYLRNDVIIIHFGDSFSETKQCGFGDGAREEEKSGSFWGTEQPFYYKIIYCKRFVIAMNIYQLSIR